MSGRGRNENLFWSADGLAAVAKVLIDYVEEVNGRQIEMAQAMGYSSTALGNFKKHYPSNGTVKVKADPDFVLLLATVLPDPASHPEPHKRKMFDGERLIRVCRGLEALYPDKDEASLPFPEPRRIIKKGMGSRTENQFAKLIEMKPSRLKEILEGGSLPTLGEISQIVGGLIDYESVDDLADLYGYGLRSQNKSLTNGSRLSIH